MVLLLGLIVMLLALRWLRWLRWLDYGSLAAVVMTHVSVIRGKGAWPGVRPAGIPHLLLSRGMRGAVLHTNTSKRAK
jgi:hypothetical protein